MPLPFKVAPDFYDNPKTVGMSDAAFSLWVRAGSYSAAKLLDGFINEDVLVRILRSSMTVADELVRRRLWRRRKGGYVFHQWEAWNETREQQETWRNNERERKRKARQLAKQNGNLQATAENVPPDIRRTSGGHPAGVPPNGSGSGSGNNPPTPQRGRGSRRYEYDSEPDFVQFWDAYPRKVGKPAAFKAWKAAIRRGAEPTNLITAAGCYRDDPDRKPEYTKHPGPWLNDERYNDDGQVSPSTDDGGWWNN